MKEHDQQHRQRPDPIYLFPVFKHFLPDYADVFLKNRKINKLNDRNSVAVFGYCPNLNFSQRRKEDTPIRSV
jgi:hypothetical protein